MALDEIFIRPLGVMNVSTKFHVNQSNSCDRPTFPLTLETRESLIGKCHGYHGNAYVLDVFVGGDMDEIKRGHWIS